MPHTTGYEIRAPPAGGKCYTRFDWERAGFLLTTYERAHLCTVGVSFLWCAGRWRKTVIRSPLTTGRWYRLLASSYVGLEQAQVKMRQLVRSYHRARVSRVQPVIEAAMEAGLVRADEEGRYLVAAG